MKRVTALVGPTAAGKSALGLEIAEKLGTEIVSIDSAQLYRQMNIGTAKPSPEDLRRVHHHLIDVIDPHVTVTVAEFQSLARDAVLNVSARGMVPLLIGGSGLYLRAVVDPLEFPATDARVRTQLEVQAEELGVEALFQRLTELDPQAASRIDPNNLRRIVRALEVMEVTGERFSSFRTGWDEYLSIYDLKIACLTWPTQELDRRIEKRVDEMIQNGLVEEVVRLESQGLRRSLTSVQTLGYAQILEHIDGHHSLDEAIDLIKVRTRRFARRQLSWFRADPRIVWFESDPNGTAEFLISASKEPN